MEPAEPPPPAQAAAIPAAPAPPVVAAPPAFALGPGCSHAILDFGDPNAGAMATKLYNKTISLLEEKFDSEADNSAVFLTSICD